MKQRQHIRRYGSGLGKLAAGLTVAVLGIAQVHAALVTEYFNYGSTAGPLADEGAPGDGWTTGWSRYDANVDGSNYSPGGRLTFNNANYNNDLNPTTSGTVINGSGNNIHPAVRSLTATGEGEVWVSMLTEFGNIQLDIYSNIVALWFNTQEGLQTMVGFRNGRADVRIAGDQTLSADLDLSENVTYLMLARLVIDGDGNDTIDLWFKAANDDISSLAALGTPDVTATGAFFDANGLTSVGIGTHGAAPTMILDALRISNDPNALQMVTLVPEPASLLLLGAGGLCVLSRQRRQTPRV